MTNVDYVNQVLAAYTALADTPDRPSRSDRALARDLCKRQVPIVTVLHAMLLATVRRYYRDPSLGQLDPIRSLHYFLPIARQLERQPLDPFYVEYLERKHADIPSANLTSERSTP
jgi:hypothetical protein